MNPAPNQLIPESLSLDDGLLAKAAEEFSTPLYIYDAAMLDREWERLRLALPEGVKVCYSVKANPSLAVIDRFHKLGAGFEVSSPGELKAVSAVRPDLAGTFLVGPGKSTAELEQALKAGVPLIAVESSAELKRLWEAASKLQQPTKALLRLNPGRAKGQQQMAGLTQFGMDPDEALAALGADPNGAPVEIVGFHAFLGTRLLKAEDIAQNFKAVFETARELQSAANKRLPVLDLGGGFGVPMYEGEEWIDPVALKARLAPLFEEHLHHSPWTTGLMVESGRFLAASSGVFLTRVVDVKKVWGRNYVIVDGGLHAIGGRDPYLGARATPLRLVGRDSPLASVTLCGPLCTPADRLAARITMPKPREGDLIALYLAGAYGLTASAGLFLSRGFPAEVVAENGTLRLVRQPLAYEALLAGQRL